VHRDKWAWYEVDIKTPPNFYKNPQTQQISQGVTVTVQLWEAFGSEFKNQYEGAIVAGTTLYMRFNVLRVKKINEDGITKIVLTSVDGNVRNDQGETVKKSFKTTWIMGTP
jgi:hypothetical protein